jgi:cell wall-associated NlpC family hydrolase
MRRSLGLFLVLILSLQNCGSSKSKASSASGSKIPLPKEQNISKEVAGIVASARKFKGTKYKYGGDSKRGMDCSGLVYVVFADNHIKTPRTTFELRSFGKWVDLKEVQTGDLVFFATKKNSRKVNHVGIVTEVMNGDLRFVHASTSKGVIESYLSERYWYFAYVQARRVL